MKEEFGESIKTCSRFSKRIEERIQEGQYSKRFLHIIGKELKNYPKFYKKVAATYRKILKSIPKQERKGEVKVQFEEGFLEKIKKTEELYGKLWLSYKQSYF